EVDGRKLENVTILDPRARSEQQIFLNACDVGIVSLVSRMKGVSMPSRTYNILAAGKPILAIAEPESETDLVVKENEIGRTVAPGDKNGLIDAIRSLAGESPAELEAMGRRARAAAERDYSLESAIMAYRQAID